MGDPSRTALVLGAQGVLGSVLARVLENEGWRVVRAGRRPEDSRDFRLVDLDRDETVHPALDGIDLVVNPTPDERFVAERVVLERGPALVNVSAVPAALGWALKRETASANGLVLIHAGLWPGVVSLVAADLLRSNPDADEVELGVTLSAGGTSGKAAAALIHRYLTAAPHHPTFRAELGAPLGARTCFEVGAEERGWLAEEVVSQRKVRLGVYFHEPRTQALFRTLNGLRIMSGVPRFTFTAGRDRVPQEATEESLAEWVAVNRAGERLAACTVEGRGSYRMTAAATAAFGEALLELRAAERPRAGVFAPEQLFTLEQLRPAFERLGFEIVGR